MKCFTYFKMEKTLFEDMIRLIGTDIINFKNKTTFKHDKILVTLTYII